jgi:DNA-binding CsgD family transcriptional regulator
MKNAKKTGHPPAAPAALPHATVVRTLTEREHRMLDLLAKGGSSAAIATALGYQEGTMRVYLHHLYKKIGVRNKLDAVIWWSEAKGSVPAEDHPDKALLDWFADNGAVIVRGEPGITSALLVMHDITQRFASLVHARARPRDALRKAFHEAQR